MLYTTDKLGEVIKTSRLKMGLTRDQLAEKIGISPRYLMSIEHEGKKTSYDVLFQLVRYLTINANDIFFPESIVDTNEERKLLEQMIKLCDKHEITADRNCHKVAVPIYCFYTFQGFWGPWADNMFLRTFDPKIEWQLKMQKNIL